MNKIKEIKNNNFDDDCQYCKQKINNNATNTYAPYCNSQCFVLGFKNMSINSKVNNNNENRIIGSNILSIDIKLDSSDVTVPYKCLYVMNDSEIKRNRYSMISVFNENSKHVPDNPRKKLTNLQMPSWEDAKKYITVDIDKRERKIYFLFTGFTIDEMTSFSNLTEKDKSTATKSLRDFKHNEIDKVIILILRKIKEKTLLNRESKKKDKEKKSKKERKPAVKRTLDETKEKEKSETLNTPFESTNAGNKDDNDDSPSKKRPGKKQKVTIFEDNPEQYISTLFYKEDLDDENIKQYLFTMYFGVSGIKHACVFAVDVSLDKFKIISENTGDDAKKYDTIGKYFEHACVSIEPSANSNVFWKGSKKATIMREPRIIIFGILKEPYNTTSAKKWWSEHLTPNKRSEFKREIERTFFISKTYNPIWSNMKYENEDHIQIVEDFLKDYENKNKEFIDEYFKELTYLLNPYNREKLQTSNRTHFLFSLFKRYSVRNSLLFASQMAARDIPVSEVKSMADWRKQYGNLGAPRKGEKGLYGCFPTNALLDKASKKNNSPEKISPVSEATSKTTDDTNKGNDENSFNPALFKFKKIFFAESQLKVWNKNKKGIEHIDNIALEKVLAAFVAFMKDKVSEFNLKIGKSATPDDYYLEGTHKADIRYASGYVAYNKNTERYTFFLTPPYIPSLIIHEISHTLLGHNNIPTIKDVNPNIKDRDIREIEAETCTYIVCNILNLSAKSEIIGMLNYIAGWSSKMPQETLIEMAKDTDDQVEPSEGKLLEFKYTNQMKTDIMRCVKLILSFYKEGESLLINQNLKHIRENAAPNASNIEIESKR